MHHIIVLVCGVASALAAPAELPSTPSPTPSKYQSIPIVSMENNVNFDGNYKYSFEAGDGSKAEQQGGLKQVGKEAGEVSQGSFSYLGDDGRNYAISYIADENGYQPQGDHLPQSPPIPEAILRSLEFLATKPPNKEEEQYNSN